MRSLVNRSLEILQKSTLVQLFQLYDSKADLKFEKMSIYTHILAIIISITKNFLFLLRLLSWFQWFNLIYFWVNFLYFKKYLSVSQPIWMDVNIKLKKHKFGFGLVFLATSNKIILIPNRTNFYPKFYEQIMLQ